MGIGQACCRKVESNTQLACKGRYRCKINDLIKEEAGTPILFILHSFPDPFSPLTAMRYLAPIIAWSFSPTMLCSALRFPEITLVLP